MTKKQWMCAMLAITICGFLGAQDVTTEKKVSFDVNLGYAPLALFAQDSIGTSFSPAGAKLGFTVFFLHRSFGNMGAEIGANWAMATTKPNKKDLVTHIIPIHVNFVHQYHFNNRLALDSYIGVGMNMFNLQYQPKTANQGLLEFSASFDVGTALQIAIYNGLYAEVGVGYIISIPKDVIMQQIVPSVSVGYRF